MASAQYVHLLGLSASSQLTQRSGNLQITSAGFQFLLHPPHEQLWELLLQYLQMAEVVPSVRLNYETVNDVPSSPGKTDGPGRSP